MKKCPLCFSFDESTDLLDKHYSIDNDVISVTCSRCGIFKVTEEFSKQIQRNPDPLLRVQLSGLCRRETDKHKQLFEVISTENHLRLLNTSGIPKTMERKIIHLLQNIAEKENWFYNEGTPSESIEAWIARAFFPARKNLMQLIMDLEKRNLLRRLPGNDNSPRFSLLPDGWKIVEQENQSIPHSTQAFVAMWFVEEMHEIYDAGIHPALTQCGYEPCLMSRKPHLNRIDDEIIAQIRKSRLMIADMTGERGGVYFEAGFAMGLDIPVIWLCNQSWKACLPIKLKANDESQPDMAIIGWKDRVHFDTRQYYQIFWDTADQLKTDLIARIEALGLVVA